MKKSFITLDESVQENVDWIIDIQNILINL